MPRNLPALLLGAALAAAAAMTLVLTSGMTFFGDSWELLMFRRDLTLDALLKPHNEHLVAIPVLIEQAGLRLFGMASATPEFVLLTAFLLATALLLYVYVKRRAGAWLALFAAILVLCLGPAWEVLLWPFEITFVGPVCFGLAMLIALERKDRRGDLAACASLTVTLGFSSLALPFIVAAAVSVLQGRGRRLRRAYVFVIPALLFLAWYVGWGHEAESHIALHNILVSPRFVAESIGVAFAGLFGLGLDPTGGGVGPLRLREVVVALVLVGLLAGPAYRRLRKSGFSPGLWPVLAAAATSWFLTAFNAIPGRVPTASRYQYASAVFILMIAANLLDGVRPSRRALTIAAGVTAIAVGLNLVVLRHGRDVFRQQSLLTRSDTAAIEIARRTVNPEFQLNPELAGTPSLIDIFAGEYLQAVGEYGSPAYSVSELDSAPEGGRRQADIVLSQALPLSTVTTVGRYRPGSGGEGCVTVRGGAGGHSGVPVSAGLTRIELAPGPHAAFALRRFAVGEYPVATEGAPGDSVTLMRIPRDALPRPWYVHVYARQLARVCPGG
jgi:hypothetical protein